MIGELAVLSYYFPLQNTKGRNIGYQIILLLF